jgi:hypothetical protein
MEYKVVDFAGRVQWLKHQDGAFRVDPIFLDEFKKEYPEAGEVIKVEKGDIIQEHDKKEDAPGADSPKRKSPGLKIAEYYAMWHLKNVAAKARRLMSYSTPLGWERMRRKSLREYMPPTKTTPEQAYECVFDAIEDTTWSILYKMPRELLKVIAEELEFLTAKYEEQKALATGAETAAESSQESA